MSLLDGALAFLFAPPAAGGGDVGAQRRNPGERSFHLHKS